ncbi:TadE/TadG family type IV pilus assembly protein [Sedimentitalea todarodis]|uniref:Pilus assembly protein n=1 Tax=Sedimentitalea todarodis TaxID=1631240 RepID=A0ABU3VBG3_9RHOB|nr:TadE/TadG family type IV pilus assembly protein [Sedimentitalea todarodis]MDU9003515.1 pilus assembly protein [Sedimentitalea todarodis]
MSSNAKASKLNRPDRRSVCAPVRAGFLRDFARDDSGAMLVFGVYAFLIILMVAGIGIDFMRFERDRSKLQATLDRAVLAAADLDQPMDPSAVVEDYFAKSGLGEYLTSVTVDEGLGYRVVSATASTAIDTQFMHMNGVDTLIAPAAGTAEERIDGVEISLVLDVSGSMNNNNRLPNLITAAREFVDTMADNSAEGDLSMSIIPYATQVAVPQTLMEQFNVSEEHRYSNCINFASDDFDTATMSYIDAYQRTMHFDPWYVFDGLMQSDVTLVGNDDQSLPVCEADVDRQILLMQSDPEILKSYISNLTARGNTSIDVGMKWGTALLDPSLRIAMNSLSTIGDVPESASQLPTNYNDGETLKVIVLMTDGQNTPQYFINEGFREGSSNVFFNNDEKAYSIYHPPADAYFWPDDNKGQHYDSNGNLVSDGNMWADHPYGANHPEGSDEGCIGSSPENWFCTERSEPGTPINLAYPDLWAHVTLKANLDENYDNSNFMSSSEAYRKWYQDVRNYVNTWVKNSRTERICDVAKDNNIIVFTIGFDAPSGGVDILKYCSSSDAHFFEVKRDTDGEKIRIAFSSIASSIRKLRLTQ